MKAIQIEEFGGPEKFAVRRAARPRARRRARRWSRSPGSASTSPIPTPTRNDYLAKQELPLIPGAEVAGPHRRRAPGRGPARRGRLRAEGGGAGGDAGPRSRRGRRRPGGGDPAAGADRDGAGRPLRPDRAGRTIVVEAAAGGTGTLAVQLAKRAGAKVIGLASSADKRQLVEELGADATVDSRAEDARGGDPRGQRRRPRRRRPPHERRRRLRPGDGGAGPAGPHGRLRNRLARAARGLDRSAPARLQERSSASGSRTSWRGPTWSAR